MDILRLGSRGPYVQAVQLALRRSGYPVGDLDGIFGWRTQRAVLQFQRDHGLVADGIVGPKTQAALRPYLCGYVLHTIRSGDTFYMLAQQYGTTVYAIMQANPTLDIYNLPVGQQITVPLAFPVVPTDIAYTAYLVDCILQGLRQRYAFLRMFSIGNSVMGKQLMAVSIGEGETEVSYNASHHANEWITTPVLLKFLEDYAAAYAAGRSISSQDAGALYEKTTLYMVPLVNPDGVDLVTGALNPANPYYIQSQAYAENYPDIPFPSGWKANIAGVDLNLQYPAGWENAKQIKYAQGYTKPGPRDFVGPSALSEPESQAMYDFTQSHDFSLTLSYHTQGEEIYWKYLDYQPPHSLQIGTAFSEASGYTLALTPYESGFAGYKDWFIQTYNLPGYTIEAGKGENPLPLDEFDLIYRDNLGILTLGMALV